MALFLSIIAGLVMMIGFIGWIVCDAKERSFSVYVESPEKSALQRKRGLFLFLIVVSFLGLGLIMNNLSSMK